MICVDERRTQPRQASSGPIEIHFDNPVPAVTRGELLDTSATGFRVRHDCKFLEAGLRISFSRAGQTGRARVVWTLIEGSNRVSGLMIL